MSKGGGSDFIIADHGRHFTIWKTTGTSSSIEDVMSLETAVSHNFIMEDGGRWVSILL